MTEFYKQLGDYTLIRRIGSGGMAEVWMAERTMMGARKTVAIKLLNAVSREKQEYRDMFLDEARLSMSLNHSSIVSVFEAGECAGECFMAMEWVDGINLSQLNAMLWERNERLPVHVAVYIAGEVLRALDHAHNLRTEESASIVHRDVSPQNVMLSVAGEVKLMDFGVARFATEETAGIHVKGKLRYMPPEQLQGQSRDPTVDLFAVGAVLHEMLDGRRFRDDFDDLQLLPKIMDGAVPPLSNASEIPAQVMRVLQGLLTPDPRLRIASARGALRMLTEWPGYRNAAIELESQVTRFRDLIPPPAPPQGTGASARVSRQDSQRSGSTPMLRDSSASQRRWTRGVNPATGTTPVGELEADAVEDTNVGESSGEKRPSIARFAAALIAGLGLAVGGLSIGLAMRVSEDEVAADEARASGQEAAAAQELASSEREAPAEEPEPTAVDGAPGQPTSTAPEVSEEQVSAEGDAAEDNAGETEDGEAEDGEAKEDGAKEGEAKEGEAGDPQGEKTAGEKPTEAKKKEPLPEVKVTFLANEFHFVFVKVGRRELALQPMQVETLRARRYSISMRTKKSDEWKRVCQGRFRPGHDYKVLMMKPGGCKVVAVN